MKILRIKAAGLPLFKEELDISFFAQQRVQEEHKDSLHLLFSNIYMNCSNAFIGINAAGKTSVLKVIILALNILNNQPINHIESKDILGETKDATLKIYFHSGEDICKLETKISSDKSKTEPIRYRIVEEKMWIKPQASVTTRKGLTDFEGYEPYSARENEAFLSDDVSFIIAYNKEKKQRLDIVSLLSFTNTNILPFADEIPVEIISFLDPTIEELYFDGEESKATIHLKFKDREEIVINNPSDLNQYLSSGTIKGIVVFTMAKEILKSGGYMVLDEIENHFNKEIVSTLVRFFMDSKFNKNGGTLIYSTHYPELLDEYDRNDSINIIRNRNGITVDNLSNILKRNDIKKSDAYQSGFLDGTTPMYDAYMRLKKSIAASI